MTVYVIADIKVTDDGWIPAYAVFLSHCFHALHRVRPTAFSVGSRRLTKTSTLRSTSRL
jgi:uncharacterized protein (DUF1330 family)